VVLNSTNLVPWDGAVVIAFKPILAKFKQWGVRVHYVRDPGWAGKVGGMGSLVKANEIK